MTWRILCCVSACGYVLEICQRTHWDYPSIMKRPLWIYIWPSVCGWVVCECLPVWLINSMWFPHCVHSMKAGRVGLFWSSEKSYSHCVFVCVKDRLVTPRYWVVVTRLGEDVGTNTVGDGSSYTKYIYVFTRALAPQNLCPKIKQTNQHTGHTHMYSSTLHPGHLLVVLRPNLRHLFCPSQASS